MNYLEDVQCPNKEFHRKKEVILRDIDDSLIYNCGCGCKFEWYGEENIFILEEGFANYEEEFYEHPKLYRRNSESPLTKAFYVSMIILAVAGTMVVGSIAIRILVG